MSYDLPELPYDYAALEPVIDAETMKIHHDKHHQAYVDKLNDALKDSPDLAAKPVEELLRDLDAVPEAIKAAVRNHGGGHYNHTLFWESMVPVGSTEVPTELSEALTEQYGGMDQVKKALTDAAVGRFGSGWGWLIWRDGQFDILSTPNQDAPLTEGVPLLLVDVWEHAYYLKYQNRRAEYLEQWWQVVNWPKVAERWQAAKA